MLTCGPRCIGFASGVYGLLLRLCPRTFQESFREETLRTFRDDCLATYQLEGGLAVLALWLRSLLDVVDCAFGEHLAEWISEHPGQQRSPRDRALLTLLLSLGVVAVFLIDENTPPETPMAIMYACVLFAAGALLPPGLAALIGGATLGVYVVDGWVAPSGWTAYRLLGLAALLTAGIWALRTGADHARLRAKITTSTTAAPGALSMSAPSSRPAVSWKEEVSESTNEATVRLLRSLLDRARNLGPDELIAELTEGIAELESPGAQRLS